jgi:hypothetical protein
MSLLLTIVAIVKSPFLMLNVERLICVELPATMTAAVVVTLTLLTLGDVSLTETSHMSHYPR